MSESLMKLYRGQAIEFFEIWCALTEQKNPDDAGKFDFNLATREEAVDFNKKNGNELILKW